MESQFSNKQLELVHDILLQLRQAIIDLREWNIDVTDMDQLAHSPQGMQRIAGNCMLIQAIGEGFKRIHKEVGDWLYIQRPEIPWRQVMSMRDRIAHGYFDLDSAYITDVINNDIDPLLEAVEYLISIVELYLPSES